MDLCSIAFGCYRRLWVAVTNPVEMDDSDAAHLSSSKLTSKQDMK